MILFAHLLSPALPPLEKPHLVLHPLKITLKHIGLPLGRIRQIIGLFLVIDRISRILELRRLENKGGACGVRAARAIIFTRATHFLSGGRIFNLLERDPNLNLDIAEYEAFGHP